MSDASQVRINELARELEVKAKAIIDLLPGFEPKHETSEPEFRALNWIVPSEFNIEWVPPFKREVYRQVLSLFFGVQTKKVG